MNKRNKNNLISNKEYEKRIIRIDKALNEEDHSKTIYIKLEYTKKSILETLHQREVDNIIIR